MINNVLRNALKVAAPIALVTALGFSQVSFAGDDFEASFEEGLNDVSSGSDRFRYGAFLNVSLMSSSEVAIPNTTDYFYLYGSALEAGGYTMFSVVQDAVDVEVGATYNMLLADEGQVDSTNNAIVTSEASYLSVYAAIVVLPASDYGISIGYMSVLKLLSPQIATAYSRQVVNLGNGNGVSQSFDITSGNGVFIEYQGLATDGFDFYSKLQQTSLTAAGVNVNQTSISIGLKYK